MDNLFGVVFLFAGLALLLGNRKLAASITRANASAFGGRAFSGRAFTVYGRIVLGLLAAAFIALGAGFVVGFFQLD
jgi:hypothetical protein